MKKKVKEELNKILKDNNLGNIEELSLSDWLTISGNASTGNSLSEDFMNEFGEQLDWGYISNYQKVSENLIKKFKHKINWVHLCRKQKVSENVLRECKEYVYSHMLFQYNFITKEFYDEIKNYNFWEKDK